MGMCRVQRHTPGAREVCDRLYPRVNALGFWDEVDALEDYLHAVGVSPSMTGTAHERVSIARDLAALDAAAARAPLHTVCEVGFNAGHSALLWLLGAPRARVVSFDIGLYPALVGARWLSRRFPGRFTLVQGDSAVSVGAAAVVVLRRLAGLACVTTVVYLVFGILYFVFGSLLCLSARGSGGGGGDGRSARVLTCGGCGARRCPSLPPRTPAYRAASGSSTATTPTAARLRT